MFVVTVSFQIIDGEMEKFLPAVIENANQSKQNEAGCLQFDVCTDPSVPDKVFLYEVYTSKDAFDIHKNTEHFAHFQTIATTLVAAKSAQTFNQVHR